MILECPSCHARFEIGAAVAVVGRKVRCSRCAHVWRVADAPAQDDEAAPAPAPPTVPKQQPVQYRPAPAPAPVERAADQAQAQTPTAHPARTASADVAVQVGKGPEREESRMPGLAATPGQAPPTAPPVRAVPPTAPATKTPPATDASTTSRAGQSDERNPSREPDTGRAPKPAATEVTSNVATKTALKAPDADASSTARPATGNPKPEPQTSERAAQQEPADAKTAAQPTKTPSNEAPEPDPSEPENAKQAAADPSLEDQLGDLFATPPAPPSRPEPPTRSETGAIRTEPTFESDRQDSVQGNAYASPRGPVAIASAGASVGNEPPAHDDRNHRLGQSDDMSPGTGGSSSPDDVGFAAADEIAPDPTMHKSHIDISAESPFATDFSEPVLPAGSRARRGQHVQNEPGHRRIMVNVGWFFIAAVVGSISALSVHAPGTVVSALPGTAKLYAAVGQRVNIRGLDFRNISYHWTEDAGRPALDVTGKIRNISSSPLRVPTVVFVLLDDRGDELYNWASTVVDKPLAAGSETAFSARVPAPPDAARRLRVRFARKSR